MDKSSEAAGDLARRAGVPVSQIWAWVLDGTCPLPLRDEEITLAELAELAGTDPMTAARTLTESLGNTNWGQPGQGSYEQDTERRRRILAVAGN